MSKYSNLGKLAKCGSVDSKFFNNPKEFDESVRFKSEKTQEFKNRIRYLILQDPSIMQQRYNNVVSVMLELKEEFEI